jgi:NDP-sugar pyrophosphorylase family protein
MTFTCFHLVTKWFYSQPIEYKVTLRYGERHLKAVVLAGGFGTRLRPLSCTRPKILLPVVNKPLLQWTFERLARANIRDVILAVFYQTEVYIKNRRVPKCGLNITYSHDPLRKPLGTGGSIKKAEGRISHDAPFVVLNGDVFADVDYAEILKFHKKEKVIATIALHIVEDPSRYGVVKLARNNRIARFIEKPRLSKASPNLINAGVYVFSPKIFSYIPDGRAVSMEREVFPRLAREGMLRGYVFDGLWKDIGKPEDYLEINKILLDLLDTQQQPKTGSGMKIMKPVAFDTGVSIGRRSLIGPHVVLGRNVAVGTNVRIQNSVILSGTVVSDSSSIDGAIVGEEAVIGKYVKIAEGCIVGDHVRIRDRVSLAGNVTICPAEEVCESVSTAVCIS